MSAQQTVPVPLRRARTLPGVPLQPPPATPTSATTPPPSPSQLSLSLHSVQPLDLTALADQLDLPSELARSLLTAVDNWPDTPISPPPRHSPTLSSLPPTPPTPPPSMPPSPSPSPTLSASTSQFASEDGGPHPPLKLWSSLRRLWDALVPPPSPPQHKQQPLLQQEEEAHEEEEEEEEEEHHHGDSLKKIKSATSLPVPPTSPDVPTSPSKSLTLPKAKPMSPVPSPASSPSVSSSSLSTPENDTGAVESSALSTKPSIDEASSPTSSTSSSSNTSHPNNTDIPSYRAPPPLHLPNTETDIDTINVESPDARVEANVRKTHPSDSTIFKKIQSPTSEMYHAHQDRDCKPLQIQRPGERLPFVKKTPTLALKISVPNDGFDEEDMEEEEEHDHNAMTPSSVATAHSRPVSDLFEHDLSEADLSPAAMPTDDDLTFLRLISPPPPPSQSPSQQDLQPIPSPWSRPQPSLRERRNSAPIHQFNTQNQRMPQSQPAFRNSSSHGRRFAFLPPSPLMTPPPTPPKGAPAYQPSPLFPSPMYSLPTSRAPSRHSDGAAPIQNSSLSELTLPPPTGDGDSSDESVETSSGVRLQLTKPAQLSWEVAPPPPPAPLQIPIVYPIATPPSLFAPQRRALNDFHRSSPSLRTPSSYDSTYSYSTPGLYGGPLYGASAHGSYSYSGRKSKLQSPSPPLYGDEAEDEDNGVYEDDNVEGPLRRELTYENTRANRSLSRPYAYRSPRESPFHTHHGRLQPPSVHPQQNTYMRQSPVQGPLHVGPRSFQKQPRQRSFQHAHPHLPQRQMAVETEDDDEQQNGFIKQSSLPRSTSHSFSLKSFTSAAGASTSTLVTPSGVRRTSSLRPNMFTVGSPVGATAPGLTPPSNPVSPGNIIPRRKSLFTPTRNTASLLNSNGNAAASATFNQPTDSGRRSMSRSRGPPPPRANTHTSVFRANGEAKLDQRIAQLRSLQQQLRSSHQNQEQDQDAEDNNGNDWEQNQEQEEKHNLRRATTSTFTEGVDSRKQSTIPQQRRLVNSLRLPRVGTVPRNVRLPMKQQPAGHQFTAYHQQNQHDGTQTVPVSPHPPTIPGYV